SVLVVLLSLVEGAAVFESVLPSPEEAVAAAASPFSALPAPSLAASDFAPFSAGLLPECLKSVAYQPLPFNWNPTADISLVRLSLPHAGQTSRGWSARRCNASRRWPQSVHRYS